jgi:hypothetical protein
VCHVNKVSLETGSEPAVPSMIIIQKKDPNRMSLSVRYVETQL